MDLPEDKGTYVLIASVAQMKRLEIGRLGLSTLFPAFTPTLAALSVPEGSARALATTWSQPPLRIGISITCWEWLNQSRSGTARRAKNSNTTGPNCWKRPRNFRIPIPRFGSSDYHRSRSSHLFYSKRRPSFRWFQQTLREGFEDICTVRYVIPEETAEGEQP